MKVLINKFKKKLNQYKYKYIRWNYFFKPAGVVTSSEDYFRETHGKFYEHISLAKGLKYCLPVPNEFLPHISGHSVVDEFTHTDEGPYQKAFTSSYDLFINVIPEGRLISDNLFMVWVITSNNQLLGDVSFQFENFYPIAPSEKRMLKRSYFSDPVYLKGITCSLLNGGGGQNNFYHWMIDIVPRIELLKRAGWFEKVDHFVVPNDKYNFQYESLELLGIPREKVIVCNSDLHIQADLLIATSHPRGLKSILVPKWITKLLNKKFLPEKVEEITKAERIYISRQDSKIRPIYNEHEIISYLKEKGFKICVLSKLSLQERIDLFQSAKVIISPTGAGLTHIIFGKPGTQVLEIFGPLRAHTHYYNLAYNAGMRYNFIVSEEKSKGKVSNRQEGIIKGYNVDIEQFKKGVKEYLGIY